ncbi:hypothetical protein Clacol_009444 [Clathrus columnatus]|uniref:Uncharacterized protein n=1 Tax=Clathrus columnatus TaxID=1419009 RepID=A0AAV5APS9_9AGAM|nr:hypothetical protein Clacol_009444 [Clathrus columnatus]
MSAHKPYCRLTIVRGSILDTLFLSETPRRPAYATTTEGHITILWSVNPRGKLLEIAQINWVGDANSGNRSTVLVNGQTMLVDNILQTSKSFFRSDAKHFVAGTKRCRWKKTTQLLTGSLPSRSYGAAWQCEELPSTNSSTSTASSGSPLAIFFPSQESLFKPELVVYPDGSMIIDHLLLTAILISVQKHEWRVAQSALSHIALEASLKTELRPSPPNYAPPSSSRHHHRPNSSHLRRPHSASTVRSRRTPPADPPPYTSIDDTTIRHRP